MQLLAEAEELIQQTNFAVRSPLIRMDIASN